MIPSSSRASFSLIVARSLQQRVSLSEKTQPLRIQDSKVITHRILYGICFAQHAHWSHAVLLCVLRLAPVPRLRGCYRCTWLVPIAAESLLIFFCPSIVGTQEQSAIVCGYCWSGYSYGKHTSGEILCLLVCSYHHNSTNRVYFLS